MIIIASREEKELLTKLRELEKWSGADKVGGLTGEIIDLKKKLTDLEIQKSKKQEEFDKQERELRHMIGLEKKRQEFEIEQARKETALSVREGNLAAEQKRFEEQLKFNTERFQSMEKYLKEMFSDVLKRLPDVNMSIKKGK
jgi:hypothetical protein